MSSILNIISFHLILRFDIPMNSHLGNVLRCRSGSVRLRWSLGFCIPNKLPDDAYTSDSGTTV